MRSKTKYIILALLLVVLPLIWLWAASRNAAAPVGAFTIPSDVPVKAEQGKCYAKCQIQDQYAGEYLTFKWKDAGKREHRLGGAHYIATLPVKSSSKGYTRTRPRPKKLTLKEASEFITELKTKRQSAVSIEQRLRPKLITRATQQGKHGLRQVGSTRKEPLPDRMTLRSGKRLYTTSNAGAIIGKNENEKSFSWQAESGALIKRQYRERSIGTSHSVKTFTPSLDRSRLEQTSRTIKLRRQQIQTHSKYGKRKYWQRLAGASRHKDFVPGSAADSIQVRWVGEAQPKDKRYQTYTPPTYKRMRTTRRVKRGASYEWREVMCAQKLTPSFISSLATALQRRGYYRDVAPNTFTPGLLAALKQYQKKNKLPIGLLDKETLSQLGLWRD